MKLFRTTILPTDDPELANRLLHSLVTEQAFVLLFVFGAAEDVEHVLAIADELAGGNSNHASHRKVVWIRDRAAVENALAALTKKPEVPDVLDPTILACSLSLDDLVCDAIRVDEAVGRGRIFKAFVLAEAGL